MFKHIWHNGLLHFVLLFIDFNQKFYGWLLFSLTCFFEVLVLNVVYTLSFSFIKLSYQVHVNCTEILPITVSAIYLLVIMTDWFLTSSSSAAVWNGPSSPECLTLLSSTASLLQSFAMVHGRVRHPHLAFGWLFLAAASLAFTGSGSLAGIGEFCKWKPTQRAENDGGLSEATESKRQTEWGNVKLS